MSKEIKFQVFWNSLFILVHVLGAEGEIRESVWAQAGEWKGKGDGENGE